MKKNDFYKYYTIAFALLIPVPGRLAYGIILILLLNFLMLCGTLFRRLIKILNLEDFHAVLISVLLVSACVLFKQFLIMFNPTMAMVIGFSIYMPAVCSFMIGTLYKESSGTLVSDLSTNMIKSGLFSIFAFLFFLVRDIFGYGTLTFPGTTELHTAVIFKDTGRHMLGNLLASIPGSLILCAIILVLASIILGKIEIHGGDKNAAE